MPFVCLAMRCIMSGESLSKTTVKTNVPKLSTATPNVTIAPSTPLRCKMFLWSYCKSFPFTEGSFKN